MKLVVLNPYLNAEHEILTALRKRGASILLTQTAEEAWTVLELHGASVDLAVLHREGPGGTGEPGLLLVKKLRESKDHADLPYILTYEKWSQQDCAAHQSAPSGANAYLRYPFTPSDLPGLIHQITGTSLTERTGGLSVGQHTNSKISLAAEVGEPAPTSAEPAPVSAPDPAPAPKAPPALIEITIDPEPGLELAPSAPSPSPAPEPPLEAPAQAPSQVPSQVHAQAPSTKDFLLNLFSSRSHAIVPGKAGEPLDEETYRKHLALREKDLVALSSQLESSRLRIAQLETEMENERTLNAELERTLQEAQRKLAHFDRDKQAEIQARQKETENLLQEQRSKNDKIAVLEARVRDAEREIQGVRERVRADLQKIRGRERELENRIEILTRDSEVLLAARESKILELKRRLDTSDFNAELLNEKLEQERNKVRKLQTRLEAIAQAMKLADGLVEESHEQPGSSH